MRNGFLLERVRGEVVPCPFCGEAAGDGHLFWECTYLPLVQICEDPEFHDSVQRDKSNWPGCLLWHGWLPALAYPGGRSSSAETAEDIAVNRLEGDVLREWVPAQGMEGGLTASRVPRYPSLD